VIVANGERLFDAVIADPSEAPQELEFEALLYLAGMAYEKKTGGEYEHVTPLSWESFSNKVGWAPTSATKSGTYTGPNIPLGNRRPTRVFGLSWIDRHYTFRRFVARHRTEERAVSQRATRTAEARAQIDWPPETSIL
jgi:hypothetical protein